MSSQLNELRLQVERLDYDNKESTITVDILKEQNQDAKAELEELRRQIAELKTAQKDASAEDKEKRKQEKMAMMRAKFDTVSFFSLESLNRRVADFGYFSSVAIARCLLREGRTITPDSSETRQYGQRFHRGPFFRRLHYYPKATLRRSKSIERNR